MWPFGSGLKKAEKALEKAQAELKYLNGVQETESLKAALEEAYGTNSNVVSFEKDNEIKELYYTDAQTEFGKKHEDYEGDKKYSPSQPKTVSKFNGRDYDQASFNKKYIAKAERAVAKAEQKVRKKGGFVTGRSVHNSAFDAAGAYPTPKEGEVGLGPAAGHPQAGAQALEGRASSRDEYPTPRDTPKNSPIPARASIKDKNASGYVSVPPPKSRLAQDADADKAAAAPAASMARADSGRSFSEYGTISPDVGEYKDSQGAEGEYAFAPGTASAAQSGMEDGGIGGDGVPQAGAAAAALATGITRKIVGDNEYEIVAGAAKDGEEGHIVADTGDSEEYLGVENEQVDTPQSIESDSLKDKVIEGSLEVDAEDPERIEDRIMTQEKYEKALKDQAASAAAKPEPGEVAQAAAAGASKAPDDPDNNKWQNIVGGSTGDRNTPPGIGGR